MIIDLTKFITGSDERMAVDGDVNIPKEAFATSAIRDLLDVKFVGEIVKYQDGEYQIVGTLSGIMILPDDVTLDDVKVPFMSEIEESFAESGHFLENNLEIVQNRLDITDFLCQNILVEIPLKVTSDQKREVSLKGDGWRLITEEELEKGNNSPLSELSKMFDSRKE